MHIFRVLIISEGSMFLSISIYFCILQIKKIFHYTISDKKYCSYKMNKNCPENFFSYIQNKKNKKKITTLKQKKNTLSNVIVLKQF